MAINIMSLQAVEATLVRNDSIPVAYRVNADKVKEDLQKAKADGTITNLLQASGKSPDEVKGLTVNGTEGLKRVNNYNIDSFFTREMPENANEDETYMIGGVSFTKAELEQTRNVMKTAIDSIGAGIGKSVTLDYRNYAEMALAENAVNAYAKENLNKEQQSVIAKAMKEYNAGLVELQDSVLLNGSYVQNYYGELSNYYGLSHVLSQEEADAINKMKEEMSRVTGKTYPLAKTGDITGTVQAATNKDLIQQIKDIFRNVDLSDKEVVSNVIEKYQELVKPVYLANGTSVSTVNRVTGKDTSSFQTILEKIMASKSYKSINIMI